MTLPPPEVERVGGLLVVRDDLIEGGTKVRFMLPALEPLRQEEFVYASPAYGYAQVALAVTARALGKRATVFVAKRRDLHRRTLEAQGLGAKVVEVPNGYMSVVKARASAYAAERGAYLVPFGADMPAAIEALAACARQLELRPTEVWCAAGSGVLTRALQLAWPEAHHHAVRVGAEPTAGAARVWEAPERFEQDAREPPPFPSCSNYDAKVWRFLRRCAAPGALFWNVAA